MIFSMLSVVIFQMATKSHWDLPESFNFALQVLIGVLLGATFNPAMIPLIRIIFIPVVTSTIVLVMTGLILATIFTRLQILDMTSAYLGTSPGAMSALIVIANEKNSSPPLVLCFHFFRILFVLMTAPLILKLIEE